MALQNIAPGSDIRGFPVNVTLPTPDIAPTAPNTRYNSDGTLNTSEAPNAQTSSNVGLFTAPNIMSRSEFEQQRGQNINEDAIREKIRRENQARVDAINAAYGAMLAQREQTNINNMGRTYAIGARGGQLGSPRGEAQLKMQQLEGERAIGAIQAQKAMDLASVEKDINQMAKDEVRARKEEALGRADAYTSYLDKAQTKARDFIARVGAGGYTVESLKEKSPQTLEKLLQLSGGDEFMLNRELNAARPAGSKIDYKTEIRGGKIISYGVDPTTGNVIVNTADAPAGINDAANLDVVTTAEGVFVYDKNNPQKDEKGNVILQKIGTPKTTAKKATPSSTSSSKNIKSAVAEMTSELVKVVGPDGFISPDAYTFARNKWIQAGFNPTSFDNEFKGFRNPNNPYYITNKQ